MSDLGDSSLFVAYEYFLHLRGLCPKWDDTRAAKNLGPKKPHVLGVTRLNLRRTHVVAMRVNRGSGPRKYLNL